MSDCYVYYICPPLKIDIIITILIIIRALGALGQHLLCI